MWPGSIELGLFKAYQPPSSSHWLGTDPNGRDIFTILTVSIGNSMKIGFIAGGIAFLVGLTLGLLTGYFSGTIGEGLTSFVDIFLIIPTWPILVIAASAFFKMEIWMMAGIVAAFSWANFARRLRSLVKSFKGQPFIDIAKINGEGTIEILFKEIAPAMLSYLAINFVRLVSWTIVTEVSLEIIGLGPQGTSTLGLMVYYINRGEGLALRMWWWLVPTITSLILIFISLQLMVMGMDSIFNPRLRTEK